MLSIFDGLRELNAWTVLLRMGLSCVLSVLIGLERSAKNRPAGFRTHVLVCVAATTAALTSLYLLEVLQLPADVSRICAQIISGLGFIGAGTIIVTKKMTIKGLTTAAGLWTTGIIGLCIGNGYYELGILGTALVLLIELVLASLASRIQGRPQFAIEVLYNEKTSLDHVLRYCKDRHLIIENLCIHSLDNSEEAAYCAKITLRGNISCDSLLDSVHLVPGIVSAISL